MKTSEKRYILWISNDSQGYTPEFFDTVEDALIKEKYTSDWYLTEGVNYVTADAHWSDLRK